MKTNYLKFLTLLALGIITYIPLAAENLIAVAKNGSVYDEANAKYVTLNQNNEDVNVIPGMVFEASQHTPGWYKVEYSPGLHAFIPEQIIASNFNTVSPGTYSFQNNPGQNISVQNSGDVWTAIVNGTNYQGKIIDNILVFVDENNKIAFSLVDIGNGPIAVTYDNSVTKFF